MIEIKNLNKKYQVEVLKNINLKIKEGEIIGIFGENGAGKTTLFKSILGFIPYSGEVLLDGKKITGENIARLSFATCEHSFFPDLTANDHLEFLKDSFKTFKEDRFNGLIDFFKLPRKTMIKKLSTGQQNQFEIVVALSQGADYILMDEPFAGNDIFNREDFYHLLLGILEENETVIIATHLIEEVENLISRAVVIKDGEIIGDVDMLDLQNQNIPLVDYIKKHYNYKSDRVVETIKKLQ